MWCGATIVALIVSLGPAPWRGQQGVQQPIPETVAKVDGVPLTREQLERALNRLIPRTFYHARVPAERLAGLYARALAELVDRELIIQYAKRTGLSVTHDEMLAEVNRAVAKAPAAEKARYRGREEELLERYRQQIERRLLIARAERAAVPEQVTVGEGEILAEHAAHPERYLHPAEVLLHHILVKVPPSASEQERKQLRDKAASIQQRLAGGAPFEELARESSDDIYKSVGGAVGWVTRDALIYPSVAARAFSIEPGRISECIQSLHGYHIIRVDERKEATPKSLSEARAEIRQRLEARKKKALREKWLAELRSTARIEIFFHPLAPTAGGKG